MVAAGQTVVRLARSGALEVAANVPEQVVSRLKVGQPVDIELWSAAGSPSAGQIRELAQSADPATRTYALRVSVSAPPKTMQIGMTATVRINDNSQPDLIHLPLSAYVENNGAQGRLGVRRGERQCWFSAGEAGRLPAQRNPDQRWPEARRARGDGGGGAAARRSEGEAAGRTAGLSPSPGADGGVGHAGRLSRP